MIRLTAEQAQQIEEALEDIARVFQFETGTPVEALAAIRAARAQEQAEQEPVGVVEGSGEWGIAGVLVAGVPIGTKLYAAPVEPVKQEPVAEVVLSEQCVGFGRKEERKDIRFLSDVEVGTDLYAAPVSAKREWVDLTDDEILGCLLKWRRGEYELQIASAVIAAFKEKNK